MSIGAIPSNLVEYSSLWQEVRKKSMDPVIANEKYFILILQKKCKIWETGIQLMNKCYKNSKYIKEMGKSSNCGNCGYVVFGQMLDFLFLASQFWLIFIISWVGQQIVTNENEEITHLNLWPKMWDTWNMNSTKDKTQLK